MPFLGVGMIMSALYVRMAIRPSSMASKLGRVDWGGIAIFIGSATSFVLSISWAGIQYPWNGVPVLVPLILGVAGFLGFGLYEQYIAIEPCVPMKVFGTRNSIAAYICTVLHALIVMVIVYILPLYYQSVKGYNTTITGIAVFPQTFTVAPAAVVIGILIGKFGRFAWAAWGGWAFTCAGMGLMYLLDADTTVPQWIFINLVSGLGTGTLFPAHQFSVQAATDDDALSAAVAMYSFFRVLGQSFGVTVGGTIVQNQLAQILAAKPEFAWQAAELSADANALAVYAQTLPDGVEKRMLQESFADALRIVWVAMCGIAGFGFLVSLLIRDYPLDRFKPKEQPEEAGKREREEFEDPEGKGNAGPRKLSETPSPMS